MSAVGGNHIECLVRIRQRGFRDNYTGFHTKVIFVRLLDDCYISSLLGLARKKRKTLAHVSWHCRWGEGAKEQHVVDGVAATAEDFLRDFCTSSLQPT
jgi:hypothetical protein